MQIEPRTITPVYSILGRSPIIIFHLATTHYILWRSVGFVRASHQVVSLALHTLTPRDILVVKFSTRIRTHNNELLFARYIHTKFNWK